MRKGLKIKMSFITLFLKNSISLDIYKIHVEIQKIISQGIIDEKDYYLFQEYIDFEQAELFEEQKYFSKGLIPDDFIEYQKIKIILAVCN